MSTAAFFMVVGNPSIVVDHPLKYHVRSSELNAHIERDISLKHNITFKNLRNRRV